MKKEDTLELQVEVDLHLIRARALTKKNLITNEITHAMDTRLEVDHHLEVDLRHEVVPRHKEIVLVLITQLIILVRLLKGELRL